MKAARSPPRSEPAKSHDFRPRLPAKRDTAQRPLRGIVRQADPAVFDEPGEGGPALGLEHVVDRFGDRVVLRQPVALGMQPAMKLLDQRPGQSMPGHLPFCIRQPVDPALDVEDRVDPDHGLQREAGDVLGRLALPGIPLDVGELEELAPGMAPSKSTLDRLGIAVGVYPPNGLRFRLDESSVAGHCARATGPRHCGASAGTERRAPPPGE